MLDTGASRRRPDKSREPSQRMGPGFHREPWIPGQAQNDNQSKGIYDALKLSLLSTLSNLLTDHNGFKCHDWEFPSV